jgi:stress-induced morphogen
MSKENDLKDIEHILKENLAPTSLLLEDQSHKHARHYEKANGDTLTHLKIHIYAEELLPLNRIQRHQKIHALLKDYLAKDLHALSISFVK